jgi:hypothetical protein
MFLYNILLEFGVPKKLVRLSKMCLNETYSKVHIGKLLSENFLFRMGCEETQESDVNSSVFLQSTVPYLFY